MKRPVFILLFLIIIVIILSVVRVTLVNNLSTTGVELSQMQDQISSYQKQNVLLKEKYLQMASLTNLEKKAEKLGFVEVNTPIYLTSPMPLALKSHNKIDYTN